MARLRDDILTQHHVINIIGLHPRKFGPCTITERFRLINEAFINKDTLMIWTPGLLTNYQKLFRKKFIVFRGQK